MPQEVYLPADILRLVYSYLLGSEVIKNGMAVCKEWRRALDDDFVWMSCMVREFGLTASDDQPSSHEARGVVQMDGRTLNTIAWTHFEPGTPMSVRYKYMYLASRNKCSFCTKRIYWIALGKDSERGVTGPLMSCCNNCLASLEGRKLLTLPVLQAKYRIYRRDYNFKNIKLLFGKYVWLKDIEILVEEKQGVSFMGFVKRKRATESEQGEAKLNALAMKQYELQRQLENEGVPVQNALRIARSVTTETNRRMNKKEREAHNIVTFTEQVFSVFRKITQRDPIEEEGTILNTTIRARFDEVAKQDSAEIPDEFVMFIHDLAVNGVVRDHVTKYFVNRVGKATGLVGDDQNITSSSSSSARQSNSLNIFPRMTQKSMREHINQMLKYHIINGNVDTDTILLGTTMVIEWDLDMSFNSWSYYRTRESRNFIHRLLLQDVVDKIPEKLDPILPDLIRICRKELQLYDMLSYYGYRASNMILPPIAYEFINGQTERPVEYIAMSCIRDYAKRSRNLTMTGWKSVKSLPSDTSIAAARRVSEALFAPPPLTAGQVHPSGFEFEEQTVVKISVVILEALGKTQPDILQKVFADIAVCPLEEDVVEDIMGGSSECIDEDDVLNSEEYEDVSSRGGEAEEDGDYKPGIVIKTGKRTIQTRSSRRGKRTRR